MKTEVVTICGTSADKEKIDAAGEIIRSGGLVAFPTETVYGLGADALNPQAAGKIYAAKSRPSDNPLIIHISRMADLPLIAEGVPETAYQLAKVFWPGPFTMIFKKTRLVPVETTGGLDTVAVRMPADRTALMLIKAAGGFIAAPSANLSGRPSPTDARHVIEDMDGRIDMILDGGATEIGLESTIIDMTQNLPVILRPGRITEAMLAKVLNQAVSAPPLRKVQDVPRAPGMKYRHYAPWGKLTVIEGNEDKVVSYINRQLNADRAAGKKTGVIGTERTVGLYDADSVKNIGRREDELSIARQLYRILRELDDEKIEIIYSETFTETGVGQAIMNRLLKAAGYRVTEVKDDSVSQRPWRIQFKNGSGRASYGKGNQL